ncbi:SMI1/KNR4 family protein [Pseudomonas protegens]|uniref:SMI1/KNR4 family protein n=1 Tax=Pseudomonas TaxID=286 RepID=UPI001C64D5C1|nr:MULTISPECIES: SMI1/KNR4 family protein [Pseudomonas]MBW8354233.1 SMI1/KNR4 family protein [Pseudomonas sp.]MDP9508204.1 SMI1/KNR4 family protein [Pseudomonas protegens]
MIGEFVKSLVSKDLLEGNIEFLGYSLDELEKIKRLYDIRISGQLQSFLFEMGRSDGGLIGDSFIQLYRPSWRVRTHLLFQAEFLSQMQEAGHYEFLNRPFVLAWVSETQYYFIQTLKGDDAVYHYDSNVESVVKTEWDLRGLLKMLMCANSGDIKAGAVGDLLEI